MKDMSDLINTLLTSIIIFSASSLMSITGFGFAILSIPFLSFIFSPNIAIPFNIITGFVLEIILLLKCYRKIKVKRTFFLLSGGIMGIPIGSYLLIKCSVDFLRIFISLIVLISAFFLFLGKTYKISREQGASLVVGFISGGLKGSVGMAGPPIVLFGINQNWEKEEFRATMIFYFTLLSLVTLFTFFKLKLFTISIVKLFLINLPFLLLGFIWGERLKNKLSSQRIFKQIALILVGSSGLYQLIYNFWKLLR